MNKEELYSEALEAAKSAYAPYSGFKVGAAILTSDGEIITGCNVENISYGGTMCAERIAVFKAVSCGKIGFSKIAVASLSDCDCTPCGMCRQVLSEFSKDGTLEVIFKVDGVLKTVALSELLPYSFNFKRKFSE